MSPGRLDAIRQAPQTCPAGLAPPQPSSSTTSRQVAAEAIEFALNPGWRGVLIALATASHAIGPHRGLDVEADSGGRARRRRSNGSRCDSVIEGGAETDLLEHGGMQSVCEGTHVGDRGPVAAGLGAGPAF